MCALLLPSFVSITSQIRMYIAVFPATKLGHLIEPWVKAIVAPDHLMWIALACAIAFVYLVRQPLWLFAKRLYAWSIYEGAVVAVACLLTIWTQRIRLANIAV